MPGNRLTERQLELIAALKPTFTFMTLAGAEGPAGERG
jgi:hypothetical protein